MTGNQFPDKVFLCESFGGHFDSIQKLQAQQKQAICQSIVYDLLYEHVLHMKHEDLCAAVRLIRFRPPYNTQFGSTEHSPSGGSSEFESSGEHAKPGECTTKSESIRSGKPPFPFRICKAMDPSIYRNIEYDVWLEGRKEFFLRQHAMHKNMPFPPGTQCLETCHSR